MRGTGGDPDDDAAGHGSDGSDADPTDADSADPTDANRADHADATAPTPAGTTDDTGRDASPVHADADGDQALADVAREVVARFREQDVPFRAAAVTYYALASFLPTLIVALAVLALVGAQDALVELLREGLAGDTVDVVDEALRGTAGAGGVGVAGLAVALWGATRVFRGLSLAFDKLYGAEEPYGLLQQVLQALVVLGFLLAAIAVVSATGVAAAYVPFDLPVPGLLWSLLGLLGLVVGLLPLYYVLPPGDVTVRHALPGAAVAAVGWVLLQAGFSTYAGIAGDYAAYGLLGALLLFVLFLYVAAVVLLVGAVVNVALAE